MLLGEKIKSAIKNQGADAAKVADYAGISVASLYRIYNKNSCEVKYLTKIAEYLKLPVMYFLDENAENVVNEDQEVYLKTSKKDNAELSELIEVIKVSAEERKMYLDIIKDLSSKIKE